MFAGETLKVRRTIRHAPGFVTGPLAIVFTFGLWISPTSVFAQADSDRATARALAEEGYNALRAQRFDVADDRFRRADALIHAPTLVVDDGRALMGLGHYVEAQERFELVLREGVADNAPAVWKAALQDAAKLLEEVKPKVAWLTVTVPNVSHPHVKIDGRPISQAAIGNARRRRRANTRSLACGGASPRRFHPATSRATADSNEGAQWVKTCFGLRRVRFWWCRHRSWDNYWASRSTKALGSRQCL